jgi:hypothetical protein
MLKGNLKLWFYRGPLIGRDCGIFVEQYESVTLFKVLVTNLLDSFALWKLNSIHNFPILLQK